MIPLVRGSDLRYYRVPLFIAALLFLIITTLWRSDGFQDLSPSNGRLPASTAQDGLSSPARPPDPVATSTGLENTARPMAVVIETQMTANLIPLMLHFSSVLGPTWTVVLFTLEEGWTEPSSPSFRRAVKAGRFEIRFLPPHTILTDSGSVSRFLTSPWIWEQVERAPRILLFQTDSIICSRSGKAVEDFFDYDFVGAPIDEKFGKGYNGGLSLRNPALFLSVVRDSNFAASGAEFEDQWFYSELKARADRGMGVNLPGQDVAKTFSVETIYYDQPLGYHQAKRWQSENMDQVEEWCPEVKMVIDRRAT